MRTLVPLLLALLAPLPACAAPDWEWSESDGRPAQAAPWREWPARGTLIVDFTPTGLVLPERAPGATASVNEPLLATPLFDAAISTRAAFVALQLQVHRRAPLPPIGGQLAQVMWSRLEAGKPYQLALTWDVPANHLEAHLNGTRQEACAPIHVPYWEAGAPAAAPPLLRVPAPARAASPAVRLRPDGAQATPLGDEALAQIAAGEAVPPLEGEGRTVLAGAIEPQTVLETWRPELSGELSLVREEQLLEAGRRRLPAEALWILEGDGSVEVQDGQLVLTTARWAPPSRWQHGAPVWTNPAHLVLWLNRTLPDHWVVSYDLAMEDHARGLHLLFFAAQQPGGGGIFAEGLPARGGEFERYIRDPAHLVSYHVSFWGAPYDRPRGSSNLRRNGDFLLLAAGDDRIAASGGNGPHHLRVLRRGHRIAAEVNGVRIIDFTEDPARHGAPLRGGLLGFRMMGDARSIRISNLVLETLSPP